MSINYGKQHSAKRDGNKLKTSEIQNKSRHGLVKLTYSGDNCWCPYHMLLPQTNSVPPSTIAVQYIASSPRNAQLSQLDLVLTLTLELQSITFKFWPQGIFELCCKQQTPFFKPVPFLHNKRQILSILLEYALIGVLLHG